MLDNSIKNWKNSNARQFEARRLENNLGLALELQIGKHSSFFQLLIKLSNMRIHP